MTMPRSFPLWPSLPPGAKGNDPERDIPSLTHYPCPYELASGTSIVVCPGGGYWEMMDSYEGRDIGLWLNERGIDAFVLKYRLASNGYHHPEITDDITRAIRHVRSHASQWKLDPAKIGVMGFSAGGHLSSYAMTHGKPGQPGASDPVERSSSRPDFGVICYALINMAIRPTKNLLGDQPSRELIHDLSTDQQVTTDTPPCFIWHTQDDQTVSAIHSLKFATALELSGVNYALHIYHRGPHGLGLGVKGYEPGTAQELHPWTNALELWFAERGLLRPDFKAAAAISS